MKTNVNESTVKLNYCSGCGICEVSCKQKAISIIYSDVKTYVPLINEKLCNKCGYCSTICPNSSEKKQNELNEIIINSDPISLGINNSIDSYRCITRKKDDLLQSASGGFVTTFAKELLSNKIIDCVFHGERILSETNQEHYKSCISYTIEEIDKRRSSIYGPIKFNETIKELFNKNLKVLAIGVPCVISGLKTIFKNDKRLKDIKLFTIALVCSHNVSGQFTDFIAQYYGIPENTKYYANFRGKNLSMKNHNSFRLLLLDKTGKKLLDKDRKIFNPLWRNYYFALDACNYCMDIWGKNADISTKDCWESEGEKDQYGSSLVIFRNKELLKIFLNMNEFEISRVPFDRVRVSEYPATVYKQKDIINRLNKESNNSSSMVFLNNSIESKNNFCEGKFDLIKTFVLNNIEKETVSLKTKVLQFLKKILKKIFLFGIIKFFYNIFKNIYHFIKKLFVYKKKQYKKIIMLGGFDGGNAGDEAQIDETIKIIQNRYPGYIVKVLSHVPYITWKNHYRCVIGPSPRMSIWDMDEDPKLYCSFLKNPIDRLRFLLRGYWCCFNAHLIKHNLPTLFLYSKRTALIEDIKTSDLLYISGGGTMTGDTLSRCWDNVFCMKIAKIFNVPFVMSGQNAGNWDSHFTKRFVYNILKDAKAVTLRDADAIDNLKEIGLTNDNIFTMFDDALFCEKLDDVSDYLKLIGIKNKYIALNLHYWGVENLKDKEFILNRVSKFCDHMYSKTGLPILCIPMSNTDAQPIEDFIGKYQKDYVKAARFYEYDFRIIRGLIANAEFCITMKHHPIIFAIGEKVPTISIAYKPYYTYKNTGALKIFDLEKYGLDMEKENSLQTFKELFDDLLSNSKTIRKNIEMKLEEIKPRREKLFKIIDTLLNKE